MEALGGSFVGRLAMVKGWSVLVVALMAWGSAAQADEHGRWQQVENKAKCVFWTPNPQPTNETVKAGELDKALQEVAEIKSKRI